jgi:hypothetical protein
MNDGDDYTMSQKEDTGTQIDLVKRVQAVLSGQNFEPTVEH